MILQLFCAFVCGFLLNFIWVRCVRATATHRPLAMANWSIGLYVCTVVSTMLICEWNVTGMLAWAVGDWIGAYWSAK